MSDTQKLAAKVEALTARVAELEKNGPGRIATTPRRFADDIMQTINRVKRLGAA